MRHLARVILRAAVLVAAVVVVSSTPPGVAQEEPASADLGPPPIAWLAPFANASATTESFDRLRTELFRTESDKKLVEALVWLAKAEDPVVRQSVARMIANSYLLGDHIGVDVRPAVRRLARDKDMWTHYRSLSTATMFDTPLARELVLDHLRGEIKVPKGEEWDLVREAVERFLRMTTDGLVRESLQGDATPEERQRWIDAASEKPATSESLRFQTADLTDGREEDFVLQNAARGQKTNELGVRVKVTGVSLWRSETDVTSANRVSMRTVQMINGEPGGTTGGGGRSPFAWGLSNVERGSLISYTRLLANRKVRVWLRFDPKGRALRVARRGYGR